MKIIRLLSLFLLTVFAFSTSIEFESFSIFYGIGQDAFSGFWGISESGNNFSKQNIGSFTCDTQLWILHHPVTIYIDEGDSVIDLDYMYRYGSVNEDSVEWIHAVTEYSGQTYHPDGYWYAYWALDHTPLFNLPLDVGENYLEIALTARVVGIGGDTLTASFVVPDSLPFLAYFTVADTPTPICLSLFVAEVKNGVVELVWKTATETENSHFLIYRDSVVIGRITGNGTCTDPHEYSFVDNMVAPGIHEYAIADVSYHSEELLHEEIKVEVEAKVEVIEANFVMNKAYPNPFNPSVTFNYQLSTINKVKA
ncbi:MAG: hypothetical protein KAH15_04435, partial [Candidatus Marinimicrobia bacterium]|nr:hypothetical protein [Candidatus Neomarinimicrobiota bacterium]